MNSCSQQGWLPFTATVVDFTFCNFTTAYELNSTVIIVSSNYWWNLKAVLKLFKWKLYFNKLFQKFKKYSNN